MFILGFILGLILLLTALWMVKQRRVILSEVRAIKIIQTSTVGELKNLSQAIENELGIGGFFKEQVEVKGAINSNTPITAELSKRPCVYARTKIEEKYEETYKDDNGKPQTRQKTTTLADNVLKTNFELDDGTGSIQVNPDEANIDAIEVVNRYEPKENHQISEKKRILGYQYNEWILPLATKFYVRGEVRNNESELVIQKPLGNENNFSITNKSKEQLLQDKKDKQAKALRKNCYIISLGLAVISILVFLFFQHLVVVNQIHAIKTIPTSRVVELQSLRDSRKNELDKVGIIKQQVEVKGKIHSNNPIIAKLSQKPCVYARTKIEEKYEETYYDDDGKRQTRQNTTTLTDNTLKTNFKVDDGTGSIQVNPDGAEIDAIEVISRYSLEKNHQVSENKRILGYQYNEWILPLNTNVYVMGEVRNHQSELAINKPSDSENNFFITHKSEEQFLQEKQSIASHQNIYMAILGLGTICLAWLNVTS